MKIENYEVKKGHVLICGKDNPTRLIPDFQSRDIPLFEGTWLFRNRGLGLILAALYFVAFKKVADDKKENFIIECTKAQIAMGDAAFLLEKKYHHLYHERLNLAKSSDFSHVPDPVDLKKRYCRALTHKLFPDFSRYDHTDLVAGWFDIRTAFLSFFKFFEEKRLGRSFDTWADYAALPRPEDATDLKTVAAKLLRSARSGITIGSVKTIIQKSKPSFSISLVAVTLAAISENGFDVSLMEKAAQRLNLELTATPEDNWTALAVAVINEIHPGGEAGRMIEACRIKRSS